MTLEIVEEYDATEDMDRLILMAKVVIRQSSRSYRSSDNGAPKD